MSNDINQNAIKRGESGLRLNCFIRTVQSNRGFTLIELLIVVAIVGMLASIAISGFSAFKEKANIVKCSEEIRSLEKEIIAYATEQRTFPVNLTEIGRQDLLDPWGGHYVYSLTLHRRNVTLTNTDFDLYSKGFDGGSADSIFDAVSLDDIIRADDGAFCNIAGKYAL